MFEDVSSGEIHDYMGISDEEQSSATRTYRPSTHIQGALEKTLHAKYNIIDKVLEDLVETPKSEK